MSEKTTCNYVYATVPDYALQPFRYCTKPAIIHEILNLCQ